MLGESPRHYTHYVDWSICGYSINSADLYIISVLKSRMIYGLNSTSLQIKGNPIYALTYVFWIAQHVGASIMASTPTSTSNLNKH